MFDTRCRFVQFGRRRPRRREIRFRNNFEVGSQTKIFRLAGRRDARRKTVTKTTVGGGSGCGGDSDRCTPLRDAAAQVYNTTTTTTTTTTVDGDTGSCSGRVALAAPARNDRREGTKRTLIIIVSTGSHSRMKYNIQALTASVLYNISIFDGYNRDR